MRYSKFFLRASIQSFILFFILLALAMLTYHGGNPDVAVYRYSLSRNFLSDLGVADPYSHILQKTTVFFWNGALTAAALCVITFVAGVSRTILARTLSGLTALSILAIGLIPSDIFTWPHRIALAATITFLTLTLATLYYEKRSIILLIGLVIAAGYLLFLFFAPLPDVSATARIHHIILQKVFIVSIFTTITLEARRRLTTN